jgi:mannosyltransferase
LKILFDGPLNCSPKSGVLLYFVCLAKELSKTNSVYFSRRITQHHIPKVKCPFFKHRTPNKLFFLLELIWFKIIGPKSIDIVHTIEYSLSPTGKYYKKRGAKHIITVYDLIHEIFGADKNFYSYSDRKSFYDSSNAIIFISNSTKNDFFKYYPEVINNKYNQVIYLASSFKEHKRISAKILKTPLFLYVGSRAGYKSFEDAIKLFKIILLKISDSKLLICGSPPSFEEEKSLNSLKDNLIWKIYPESTKLEKIYRKSFALLYSSSYEGFGLPLLEAMSQGCIPIAKKHSSIPEVLGKAGIILDKDNFSKTADTIINILKSPEEYNKILCLGYKQASNFDWGICSKDTHDFYSKVIDNSIKS